MGPALWHVSTESHETTEDWLLPSCCGAQDILLEKVVAELGPRQLELGQGEEFLLQCSLCKASSQMIAWQENLAGLKYRRTYPQHLKDS